MQEIILKLTIDEVNTIIEGLGELKFSKVYKLIEKLHLQAKNQLHEVNNADNQNEK